MAVGSAVIESWWWTAQEKCVRWGVRCTVNGIFFHARRARFFPLEVKECCELRRVQRHQEVVWANRLDRQRHVTHVGFVNNSGLCVHLMSRATRPCLILGYLDQFSFSEGTEILSLLGEGFLSARVIICQSDQRVDAAYRPNVRHWVDQPNSKTLAQLQITYW